MWGCMCGCVHVGVGGTYVWVYGGVGVYVWVHMRGVRVEGCGGLYVCDLCLCGRVCVGVHVCGCACVGVSVSVYVWVWGDMYM